MNKFSNIRRLYSSSTLIPWSTQSNLKCLSINKAKGPHIWSHQKKIVDFTCGAMAVSLGHQNSYIQEGFHKHIKTGISYVPSNFATEERDKLSHRLVELAKFDKGKVLYGNAGADSNEMACFLSQEYHHIQGNFAKQRILAFQNSFHGGSTIGASILSGDQRRDAKDKYFKMPLEPILMNPSFQDNGLGSLQDLEDKLDKRVGAIIIEGSSGTAGCFLYPTGYLQKVQELCRQRNILIICDEVMSGFGRTGEFFAHFKQDIEPDFITCAKAITNGAIPLGAIIINHKVSKIFEENPVLCGLTYSGHPLSCTIANRCLDLYCENNMEIIKGVEDRASLMSFLGNHTCSKYDWIKDYRSNGLLGCWEFDLLEDDLVRLSSLLLAEGVYCLRIRHNIFTAPTLNISKELLKETMERMDKVFSEFKREN